MDYEWDDANSERNFRIHRVPFAVAIKVFDDPLRVEFVDDRFDYGETRWVTIGDVGGAILYVASTRREQGSVTRIISARRATRSEAIGYHESSRG